MPAARTAKGIVTRIPKSPISKLSKNKSGPPMFAVGEKTEDLADCNVVYPLTSSERTSFRSDAGKRVTPHQWAVYDYVRTIPCGKVTTYKDISAALGEGSPRSIGGALRNNPFAPFVPCHRIVASNLFVGGFYGEWGVGGETDSKGKRKMRMLAKEGVTFTEDGFVQDQQVVWRG